MTVDASDRTRATTDLGTSIALSAGAGSGKTTVLAQRLVGLLAAGVDPARIVAVTFTEKAAGELQERVRDTLERRVATEPVLADVVPRLADLTVSTIHAFCRKLLISEALDAGWAPDSEILPALLQTDEVERAYQAWEASFRARHPVAGLVVRQRVNAQTLRLAAMRLLAYRDLQPIVGPPFDAGAAFAALVRIHAALGQARGACKVPDEDKLLAANRPLLALLDTAVARPPGEAIALVLGSRHVGKFSGGKAADWAGGGKQAFVAALGDLGDWRTRQDEQLHAVVVTDLLDAFVPAVEAAKRAAAVADYDDLLFRAAALLSQDRIRARLAERYERILVDEVQDTDPIQAEVAALLTRDPAAAGPWSAAPPRSGRLFAVGDPRQSIYRFRRADVETWEELAGLVARGGAALTLTVNFRSVPGIVDWVNATFADLRGYVPQQPVRPPAELEPVVRLACEGPTELDAVAAYLWSVRTGRVVDRATDGPRLVRWSDVMILLPSWTAAEEVQQVLTRAGIPALVEGGGAFFGRDEVRVALAALRCLEDPVDEPSTLLVLRGLFGIDWNDLSRHRAAGGRWRYTVPDPPPGPVADAYRVLLELARQRGRASWVAILDELLERTRAAAVWAALGDAESRLANLDKLRALVRQIEGPAWSPGETMRRLEALTDEPEKDLSRVDLDSDAVRVTSYFKAKGLEAPIVVLCAARRNQDGVVACVDRRTRQVALKVGDLRPPGWDTHKEREQEAAQAERRRWMYVAATRARDQLVIVDHEDARLVREHLAAGLASARTVDAKALPAPPWRTETFPGHDAAVDRWLAEPPAADADPTAVWAAARADRIRAAGAACVRWRSVVEVAARERVSGASSAVGAVGGIVVHEVMEQLDLARPADELLTEVPARVAAAAASRALDDAIAGKCADIVAGLLRHPVIERARQAPERWVEVPFSIRDHGRMVSGRIDLCFPTDASRRSWVVVDWKSELPPAGTPGWRNYQRQLGWYAEALLRTVSPCEQVETVLVGPYPDLGPGATGVDVLAEVLPELAPLLQALLDDGVPMPRIGADVGDPLVAVAELAWDDARVALCLGNPAHEVAALRVQGWTVVEADPTGLTWAADAMAAVARTIRQTWSRTTTEGSV